LAFCSGVVREPSSDALIQVNIDDGFLNLIDGDGTPKDDVKLPDGEVGDRLQSGFDDGKDMSKWIGFYIPFIRLIQL
jgi:hypothetical protein